MNRNCFWKSWLNNMVSDRGKRNKKVWHIPRRTKIDGNLVKNFGTAMIVQMAKQIVEYILIRTRT